MNRLNHVVTYNLKNYKDQINEAINREPTFDASSFNLSSGTRDPLPVVTVSLLGVNKHRAITVAGITCLWDSGATDSMIKIRHTKHYGYKMRSNKVDYSTATCVYCTTHDFKVPFFVPKLSSRKIINHRFHVDNNKRELGIGYDMIIGRDLMIQIGLTVDFKHQVLQWDGANVHMKYPSSFLGQSDLTKCEMREVVMQAAEPDSAREATEQMVKIIDSTYAKADFKQVVDNTSQMNDEEITLLLSLLEYF